MSLRVMSSRTFSIADFEGSAGGGLMSVGPGMMGEGFVCDTRGEGQSLSRELMVLYEEILP